MTEPSRAIEGAKTLLYCCTFPLCTSTLVQYRLRAVGLDPDSHHLGCGSHGGRYPFQYVVLQRMPPRLRLPEH